MPDMSVLNLLVEQANNLTGVSEYTLGQSAGERTATGANAVATSVNRRHIPVMKKFIKANSMIADMWLKLIQENWSKEEYIMIHDEEGNQLFQAMKNTDLLGKIKISLDMEGLAGAADALKYQKLLSTLQTLMPVP